MSRSKAEQFWSDHLDAIAAEGISTKAYARRESLSAWALYYWRKRLKDKAPPAPCSQPRFVAVQVTEARPKVVCTLALSSGVRLEMADLPAPEWLTGVWDTVSRGMI